MTLSPILYKESEANTLLTHANIIRGGTPPQAINTPFVRPSSESPLGCGGRFFFTRYGVLLRGFLQGCVEGGFGVFVKSILTVYVAHSGYYRNYSLKNSSMARAPPFFLSLTSNIKRRT